MSELTDIDIELAVTGKQISTSTDGGNSSDSSRNADTILTFQNVTFEANVTKLNSYIQGTQPGVRQILKGITGYVKSGQVVAVIGPSGAGKTTLLDTLARSPRTVNNPNVKVSGAVCLNGKELDSGTFRRHCAYVPQEDLLWAALTVRENLQYAASLYGAGNDGESSPERVSKVIRLLGLESCADTKVGNLFIKGISGGQKRRLSLGMELVAANQNVLFLDEPTSGLDAASAIQIMDLVTRTARKLNVAVLCTIHQPASQVFFAFDRLLLLSAGRTAYFGPAKEAMGYFEALGHKPDIAMNPADYLLQVVNSDFVDKSQVARILDAFPNSTQAEHMLTVVESGLDSGLAEPSGSQVGATGLVKTVGHLVSRTFLNYRRDPAMYVVRLMMYAFMGIFLGSTYYDIDTTQEDVLDRLFLVNWLVAFFSYMCMVALPAHFMERSVVSKEVVNGMYGPWTISFASSLVQIPFVFMEALVALLPAYWIVGLNEDAGNFFQFLLIFFVHLYVVESIGVLLGSIISNFVLGLVIFNSIISMYFVFNGFFISNSNMPPFWVWIYYISPMAYTTQALIHITFQDVTFAGFSECVAAASGPCYGTTGEQILDSISSGDLKYNDVDVFEWLGVLIAMALFFRILSGYITARDTTARASRQKALTSGDRRCPVMRHVAKKREEAQAKANNPTQSPSNKS